MTSFPILSAILALPLLGALACLLTGAQGARWIALATTLATLALCIGLWLTYQIGGPQWQFVERIDLFGGFRWALGIDGIACADRAHRLSDAICSPPLGSDREAGPRNMAASCSWRR